MTATYQHQKTFQLESGKSLPGFHLAYTTSGQLNERGDNAVWVFHALTANSNPQEWWPGLVGDDKLFDPAYYFIVCVNMPGSCYGSIGPLDAASSGDGKYYHDFPWFTTRDMIRAYQHLKTHLGIQKIFAGVGGSMGGQQLLEWAIEEPELFEHIFPIATNAFHSPWAIAFNATQRSAIELDPSWGTKEDEAGKEGMKTARAIALISYRHYHTYGQRQQGLTDGSVKVSVDKQIFRSETYQRYQGEKLAKRFNAFSYYFLTKGMDAHNVGRGRPGVERALQKITAKTLVIGIETDILFPLSEQRFLAENIRNSEFVSIQSMFGHDGFLLEFEQITDAIKVFFARTENFSNKHLLRAG